MLICDNNILCVNCIKTNILNPQILAAEKDFFLVYKPPRMHSSPQVNSPGETLLDWCAARFPEIMEPAGRRKGEGGLLHRLDYETHGLMLIARNSKGMISLLQQHREGIILKEYNALTTDRETVLHGFPAGKSGKSMKEDLLQRHRELYRIKSAFRPYGPGRRAVRPVLIDNTGKEKPGRIYITEILESRQISTFGFPSLFSFRLRISRGFRHQIRSHLAWLGMPIINDRLYGGLVFGNDLLALRASSLLFNDPSSGEGMCYSIPQLELSEIL